MKFMVPRFVGFGKFVERLTGARTSTLMKLTKLRLVEMIIDEEWKENQKENIEIHRLEGKIEVLKELIREMSDCG